MRLSPFDPLFPFMASFCGQSVLLGARLSRLDRRGAKPLHSLPNFRQVYNTLIAALRQIGQTDEARTVMAERIERFGAGFRLYMALPLNELLELRPEDRDHLIVGFHKAGLAD